MGEGGVDVDLDLVDLVSSCNGDWNGGWMLELEVEFT